LAMPQVVAIVMNVWTLIFFASYGYGLFVPEIAEAQGASPFGLLLYGLVAFTLGIWSVVISVAAIAEAHRFSIVRAVLTSILTGILIAVVILALAFGIGIMFVKDRMNDMSAVTMKRLTMEQLDAILTLQRVVHESLEDSTVLQPLDEEEWTYLFSKSGAIGLYDQEELIAVRAYLMPPS